MIQQCMGMNPWFTGLGLGYDPTNKETTKTTTKKQQQHQQQIIANHDPAMHGHEPLVHRSRSWI